MFCQVERAYIEDGFNLYGLRVCVSNYSDCLDLILDRIGPEDSDDSHLTQNACTLYGLIHARYIVTTHGLDSMYNKVSVVGFWHEPITLVHNIISFLYPNINILHPIFPHIAQNQKSFSVCSKRVWNMPSHPMQRSTSSTRRPTRRNRHRHYQNLLSQMQMRLPTDSPDTFLPHEWKWRWWWGFTSILQCW